MALQLASESLGEREGRDFQRRRENPPSPATERRLLLTTKRFHTVCNIFETNLAVININELGRAKVRCETFADLPSRRNVEISIRLPANTVSRFLAPHF
jgi:hypothetical protein